MTALGETASGDGGDDTPVERAMEMLSSSLAELIRVVGEGGLGHFDSDGLLEFMRSFERARNQMSVVDHEVVAECERRALSQRLGCRNTKTLVT
jgi:hypothetical protein